MQNTRNPFADRGPIVREPSFLIGRQDQLRMIKRRLLQGNIHANLAIIGERRIGASTLAYQATQYENLWKEYRIIVAWIPVGSCQDASDLFFHIGKELIREGEKVDIHIDDHGKELLLNKRTSPLDQIDALKDYFELLGEKKIKAICILDDFDKTTELFKNNISYFQLLRELGYYPRCRISLVIVSRRSIGVIEEQSGAVSTLEAIFEDRIVLQPFSRAEMEKYFSFYEREGVRLADDQKEEIVFFCGGWPYLLNHLGYEIVEDVFAGKQVDVTAAFSRIESVFEKHYYSLTRMFALEGRLETLIALVTGQGGDENGNIREFIQSGVVREISVPPGYVAYSGHFQEYLENLVQKKTGELQYLVGKLEQQVVDVLSWIDSKKESEELPSLSQLAKDPRCRILALHLGVEFQELKNQLLSLSKHEQRDQDNIEIVPGNKKRKIENAQELLDNIDKLLEVKDSVFIQLPGKVSSFPPASSFGLHRIIIHNYHGIKHVDLVISPQSRWIFLTGENGFGKTLFLRALVLALHGGGAKWGGGHLAPKGFNSGMEVYEGEKPMLFNYGNKHFFQPFYRIAAYGPSRLSIRQADTGEEAEKRSAKTYGIFHSDGVLLNIERSLLDLHKQANEDRGNPDNQYHVQLKVLKEMLLQLLNGRITKIETSGTKVRYLEKNCKEGRTLNELASGFRSIIALAGDIIIRLLDENRPLEKPEQLSGIVVIDELDLHLHPKYQKRLPGLLSKVFPNVLFIAAIHSPIPILGAPADSTFLKVSRNKGEIKVENLEVNLEVYDIRNLQPNIILSSPIFDMEDIFHNDNENIIDVRTEDTDQELQDNVKTRRYINDNFDKIVGSFKKPSES